MHVFSFIRYTDFVMSDYCGAYVTIQSGNVLH